MDNVYYLKFSPPVTRNINQISEVQTKISNLPCSRPRKMTQKSEKLAVKLNKMEDQFWVSAQLDCRKIRFFFKSSTTSTRV